MIQDFQKLIASIFNENIVKCFELLENEVNQGSFTSWSFANTQTAVSAYWADEYQPINTEDLHPIFDLASLTKPLFLNLYLILLLEKNYFEFINKPLNQILNSQGYSYNLLSEFIIKKNNINLNSFLSHHSGLEAWTWMGLKTKEQITKHIFSNKFNNKDEEIYSDLNYYVLARIFENIFSSKDKSDLFWKEVINKINLYTNAFFKHVSIHGNIKCIPFYPYTIKLRSETLNHKYDEYGFIHDVNANILSSLGVDNNVISGHAGLFGNVTDISKALNIIFNSGLLSQFGELKKRANRRFIYGFDTPSSLESTAGIRFWETNKNQVFGHLGYAGTSFWMHEKSKCFHILLTNRTAKRKFPNAREEIRIYIFEDLASGKKRYFAKINNIFQEKNSQEIIKITQQFANYSKIIWDTKWVPKYANISSLRTQVGLNLWQV